jgi:hypothetical protein
VHGRTGRAIALLWCVPALAPAADGLRSDKYTAPAAAASAASAPARSSAGAALRISGRMDDATVNGVICGDPARPFTANSPEVGGSWQFTPTSATTGTFTYKATDVGGVPGSGAGRYVIMRDASGGGRIKLDGTGSIHSPVGTFSATIFETLTLTPVTRC